MIKIHTTKECLNCIGETRQSFSVDDVQSKLIRVDCSFPQGSVLGPLEFISYTEDVVDVFTRNRVHHHLFDYDKQLYRIGKVSEIDTIRHQLCCCVTDLRDWCSSRRIQLNALKTELQWFGSRANLRKFSSADQTLSVGNDVIQLVTVVHEITASSSTMSDDEAAHQSCCHAAGASFNRGDCVKSVALL